MTMLLLNEAWNVNLLDHCWGFQIPAITRRCEEADQQQDEEEPESTDDPAMEIWLANARLIKYAPDYYGPAKALWPLLVKRPGEERPWNRQPKLSPK
jgi:hypothetical protein